MILVHPIVSVFISVKFLCKHVFPVCPTQSLLPFQVIELPLPVVGIVVLLTTLTFMCSEVTTLTMMSQGAQRMKIIHCLGSFGGTTLPQAAGSRFGQRGTCPQSWLLCQLFCTVTTSLSLVEPGSLLVKIMVTTFTFVM